MSGNAVTALQAAVREVRATRRNVVVLASSGSEETHLTGMLCDLGDLILVGVPVLPTAMGLVLAGQYPIVDATDVQLASIIPDLEVISSLRYRTGGVTTMPLLVLASVGGRATTHYMRTAWGALCRIPGLKVAVPTTAQDVEDMVRAAVRERGPVALLLDADLMGPPWGARNSSGQARYDVGVPLPLMRARIVLPGEDVTVVTMGWSVDLARQAIRRMRTKASVELIDLRVLAPWDRDTVLSSVEKSGRVVVVDEDGHGCGLAAEVLASVAEVYPPILIAPPQRVTRTDVPIGSAAHLVPPTLPSMKAIGSAITRVLAFAPRRDDGHHERDDPRATR